ARLRLLLVLIVIALILTRSRMGNGSFMVGLLLAASVYWWRARTQRRGMALFVVSLLVIDLVLIGAWVGVDKVVQRVQETRLLRGEVPADAAAPDAGTASDSSSELALTSSQTSAPRALAPAAPEPRAARPSEESLEDRVEPVLEARTMIADNPWLGTGGGTFNLAFLGYAPRAQGYYSHAHNDYLEIASDTGLPGMAALLVLALAGFRTALRILRDRRNEVVRAAAFAALMSITCMALHSLVDFNLQIPSNAITFSVMVALPFAAAAIPSGRSRRRRSSSAAAGSVPGSRASGPAPQPDPTDEAPPSRARAALGPLLAGATIVLLGYVAFTAVRYGMADLQAIRTNERGAQLQAAGGPPSVESLRALEALVAPVIALAPEAADYREMLGGIHFTRAGLPDRDPDLSRQDYAQAAAQYRLATVLSRRSGYAWGNLLLAKHRAGEIDDEFNLALANAARFAPFEAQAQLMVLEAGLKRWDRLPEAQRDQVAATVARGLATDRDALLTEAAAAPDANSGAPATR
ncbi:MAG: O-antigen ligase family protein, partial [Burkholderiaceae bacterium]|nr:O-antigen ligase family protein [Burkholderiaceae bacterium]